MKTFDIVIGNGCSFTQGGGLNNYEIHKFLTGVDEKDMTKLDAFMFKNSYPAFLGKLLNCKWYNNSLSCASNDLIIQRGMDIVKQFRNKKILIINQLSIPARLGVRKGNKYISFNNTEGQLVYDVSNGNLKNPKYRDHSNYSKNEIDDFYKKYLLDIYDVSAHWKGIRYMMELYNGWCEKNNVLNYWLCYTDYEEVRNIDRMIKLQPESEHTYKQSICAWSDEKRYQLRHIKNIPEDDSHLSIEGHKELANIIYNTI